MQELKIQYILEWLKLNKELYRFIDTVGDVPYIALPCENPEIICFAGRIKELTGCDANEILAGRQHWANIIHPDDQEQVFDAFAKCKNEGMSFYIEYRIVHKDGSLRFVCDKGEPVFNDEGKITQVEGMISAIGKSGRIENIPTLEMPEVTAFSNGNSGALRKI